MKILLAALISISPLTGFSQTVIDVGKSGSGGAPSNLLYVVGGVPMNNAKYVAIIEGSSFFNEAMLNGRIILSGGKIYSDIKMRLDLMDNTVHYMGPEGEELIATTPIKSIFLTNPVSQKEDRFDNSDFIMTLSKIEAGWYQLLDTGAVSLYKRHSKLIRENKPYGSATVEQYITTTYSYHILINSVFTSIKKITLLPGMLQDKKTELQEYIISNNLTGKSDKDYLALISYYKSLVAKK